MQIFIISCNLKTIALTKTKTMFRQNTVKSFSIVAIILSSLGLLSNVLGTLFIQGSMATFSFFMGIVSWAILLWASVISYQLCGTSYKLDGDDYKKIGIRIYLIIAAFILFIFVGLILGLVLSVILLGTLWGLKSGYDEWDWDNSSLSIQDPNTSK
jgi:hypothetical protein